MHYSDFITKAFDNIRKYPALLLPETILFFATYFLTIGLYRFSGLSAFAKTAMETGQKIDVSTFIRDFAAGYSSQIIFSLAAFVIITFVMGAGTEAIKFRMIKKITDRMNVSIKDLFNGSWRDFFRIVGMKMIIYLIALVIFLCLMLAASFLLSLGNGFTSIGAWVAAGIGLAVFVILSIGLLFRYAILFMEEQNAATTVRWSFHYFKKHTNYVIILWLIYLGIGILFTIASAIATMMFTSLRGNVDSAMAIYFVSFIGTVAAFAIRLVYNVWTGLFLFEAYSKNKIVR
ncbi:MAG: hypothetical protein PHO02_06790 [Candidatus Nanoarchaeia archaeon]|nr:hypothetical protein [Candidatus Nanoarchaeia archaeon]